MFNDEDIIQAHKFSIYNREDINKSYYCGCFYCCRVFRNYQIEYWIDNNNTALCPFCSIDSVIGDFSGYPIDKEFLSAMKKRWF